MALQGIASLLHEAWILPVAIACCASIAAAEKKLFVIAGQSNAEGYARLDGLEKLVAVLSRSDDSKPLTQSSRDAARRAIAESQGVECNSSFSTLSTADKTIDELRASSVNWRAFAAAYSHPTVKIRASHYIYAPVLLRNRQNGSIIDNQKCSAVPSETFRSGPALSTYRPSHSNAAFTPLAAGFGGHSPYAAAYGLEDHMLTYGIELSYGAKLAGAFPDSILLKVAMGHSSLGDHWRVDGPLYAKLIQEIADALQNQQASLGGLVWFQGFSDQWNDAWCQSLAAQYQANLLTFLQTFRADVGFEVPIVVVQSRNPGIFAYTDAPRLRAVQQAQAAVSALLPKVSIVPSADVSDCFHYGSGSLVVIGERAAEAMLELLGSFTTTTSLTATTRTSATSTSPTRTSPTSTSPIATTATSAGRAHAAKLTDSTTSGQGTRTNLSSASGSVPVILRTQYPTTPTPTITSPAAQAVLVYTLLTTGKCPNSRQISKADCLVAAKTVGADVNKSHLDTVDNVGRNGRPQGCTLHRSGNVEWFGSSDSSDCGSLNYDCVCKSEAPMTAPDSIPLLRGSVSTREPISELARAIEEACSAFADLETCSAGSCIWTGTSCHSTPTTQEPHESVQQSVGEGGEFDTLTMGFVLGGTVLCLTICCCLGAFRIRYILKRKRQPELYTTLSAKQGRAYANTGNDFIDMSVGNGSECLASQAIARVESPEMEEWRQVIPENRPEEPVPELVSRSPMRSDEISLIRLRIPASDRSFSGISPGNDIDRPAAAAITKLGNPHRSEGSSHVIAEGSPVRKRISRSPTQLDEMSPMGVRVADMGQSFDVTAPRSVSRCPASPAITMIGNSCRIQEQSQENADGRPTLPVPKRIPSPPKPSDEVTPNRLKVVDAGKSFHGSSPGSISDRPATQAITKFGSPDTIEDWKHVIAERSPEDPVRTRLKFTSTDESFHVASPASSSHRSAPQAATEFQSLVVPDDIAITPIRASTCPTRAATVSDEMSCTRLNFAGMTRSCHGVSTASSNNCAASQAATNLGSPAKIDKWSQVITDITKEDAAIKTVLPPISVFPSGPPTQSDEMSRTRLNIADPGNSFHGMSVGRGSPNPAWQGITERGSHARTDLLSQAIVELSPGKQSQKPIPSTPVRSDEMFHTWPSLANTGKHCNAMSPASISNRPASQTVAKLGSPTGNHDWDKVIAGESPKEPIPQRVPSSPMQSGDMSPTRLKIADTCTVFHDMPDGRAIKKQRNAGELSEIVTREKAEEPVHPPVPRSITCSDIRGFNGLRIV
eukprot:TRINITY_DN45056_c0_g1_i1.p1 TRINITY_DN45056_c0_g1~~TRINITY_DN45056_c0_g1_i1.p1  ORF type:complete len:1286 (+),score=154.18 TRINITY_DN45056_c0_g1_i1:116-3973(+)